MLIAVEGCVGSGKTTIARGLAACRKAQLLLEDFSDVPFLEAFYRDPTRYALETEFSFLLQHYHQLRTVKGESGEIVADFAMHKDVIFADLNMPDAAERKVFGDLYRLLVGRAPVPDYTVFVSASDDLILERIQARGRSFELAAPPEYFRRLNAGYEAFFSKHSSGVIRISADEMDFCKNPELYRWLSTEIASRVGRGNA